MASAFPYSGSYSGRRALHDRTAVVAVNGKRGDTMFLTASRTYWLIVITLLGVSVYFFVHVEQYRAGLAKGSGKDCLKADDAPVVERVVDGDEVLVKTDKCRAVIRLLGIKAFDPEKSEPPLRPYANLAMNRLKRLVGQKVSILAFAKTKVDSRGRTLAKIAMEGQDVGLNLVREGFVLVFRKYPFVGMDKYLGVETQAASESKGLWADPDASARARALQAAFDRERKK